MRIQTNSGVNQSIPIGSVFICSVFFEATLISADMVKEVVDKIKNLLLSRPCPH